ncbi:MAG: sugar transferase [Patescibacteria group bacterium]|nr:sugar transferase [Patescibacteria group bacterium]
MGKNDFPFTLYKFRTMKIGVNGPLATEKNDKRVFFVGKILRFTHLDELPQLWNILKGDISFIGPRPESSDLVEIYKKLPYYEIRHIIKPGLTGWAQVNYKASASPEEAHEKLRYDIYYIKNRSLVLDFLILLKTIKYIFVSHK